MPRRPTALLLLLPAFIAACQSPGSSCPGVEDPVPVLTVRSVTSAADGGPVPRVTLADIQVDGGDRALESIPTFEGATLRDGYIECEVPCGIGMEQGTWSFTLNAEGYQPQREHRKAFYRMKATECGDVADGSRFDFTLQPG